MAEHRGGAAAGCMGLIALGALVAYCSPKHNDTSAPAKAAVAETASPISTERPDPQVAKAETIVKEQFAPEETDHSGSASYQREWWMIKGAVRQAGYPCAAVSFVQQQVDGTFKAVCKVKLHSNHFDAFVIDPDKQTVDPL